MSENILKSVGSSIGTYIKSDPSTFVGGWKPYVRIRVSINISKPLKRKLKIKREGNDWSWLNFKYEKLGTFCFVCGIIGHAERDCNVVYAHPEKIVEKAYGTWLRAPNKNMRNNTGARWLRNLGTGDGGWGSSQNVPNTAHGDGKEDARFMEIDGVIRQATVETTGIKIQSRDNREKSVSGENVAITEYHVRKVGEIAGETAAENIVMETKRKRVEEDIQGENQGNNMEGDMGTELETGPKNLLLAGPGIQARQEL